MDLRLILITSFLSYVTAKNICVLYVLNNKFNQALNLVDCDSEANDVPWEVVNFEKENINPRSNDGINALPASKNSCGIVEIGFLSEGTLEADVFVSSPECVVNIRIDDTEVSSKSTISSSGVNPLDKTSDLGWRILSMDIEKDIQNARITLQASCSDAYVLITSLKHIPLGSTNQHCRTISKQNLNNIKNTLLTHIEKDNPELSHNVKSKATDVDVVITKVLRNDEESSFWSPLTISLITLSITIVLIVLAITAYQCGKSKGLDEVNVFWNDNERTLTIPRARSIYSQSISRSQYSGQYPLNPEVPKDTIDRL